MEEEEEDEEHDDEEDEEVAGKGESFVNHFRHFLSYFPSFDLTLKPLCGPTGTTDRAVMSVVLL